MMDAGNMLGFLHGKTENRENKHIKSTKGIRTCSFSSLTSGVSLFDREAPCSTVETRSANFNVLIVSPRVSASGLM